MNSYHVQLIQSIRQPLPGAEFRDESIGHSEIRRKNRLEPETLKFRDDARFENSVFRVFRLTSVKISTDYDFKDSRSHQDASIGTN